MYVKMRVGRPYSKFLIGTLISITFLFVMYISTLHPIPINIAPTQSQSTTPTSDVSVKPKTSLLREVKGWEVNKSRDTSLYVRPFEETVLMSGAHVCPPAPLLLYIVVCSSLGNGEARSAIRDTWAREIPPTTAVVFLVGRSENETLMMRVAGPYSKYLIGTLISITFLFVMYNTILQPTPINITPTQSQSTTPTSDVSVKPKTSLLPEVKGWEFNKSRDTSLYVRPFEETVLMSGAHVCPPAPLLLYIVVCSALGNGEARSAIRDTWAREIPPTTAVVFLVGRSENETLMESVREEQMIYRDVVQEDFIESYNNLTIASIMMLKFSLQHCSHFQYLVKADDDIYLNVHKLFDQLTSGKVVELAGFLVKNAPVIRNPNQKWYTPEYIFSQGVYPNYLAGYMYIMSRNVATTLYNVSLQIPLLHHEDVFITGICASEAGLKPRHIKGRFNDFNYFNDFNICNSDYITVHHVTPADLRRLWKPIEEHRC